jgi:hypothetical protein
MISKKVFYSTADFDSIMKFFTLITNAEPTGHQNGYSLYVSRGIRIGISRLLDGVVRITLSRRMERNNQELYNQILDIIEQNAHFTVLNETTYMQINAEVK